MTTKKVKSKWFQNGNLNESNAMKTLSFEIKSYFSSPSEYILPLYSLVMF